jgi:hypothetical protein
MNMLKYTGFKEWNNDHKSRIHPTIQEQKAALTVEYGPQACHSPCLKRVDFERHDAMSTELMPKK